MGGGIIFMSMFQSILNTFGFGYSLGGKKLIILTDGGFLPPFTVIPEIACYIQYSD